MIIKIRKWDIGNVDVIVERYGYTHTHKSVSDASLTRINKLAANGKQAFTRKYDSATTTIKL